MMCWEGEANISTVVRCNALHCAALNRSSSQRFTLMPHAGTVQVAGKVASYGHQQQNNRGLRQVCIIPLGKRASMQHLACHEQDDRVHICLSAWQTMQVLITISSATSPDYCACGTCSASDQPSQWHQQWHCPSLTVQRCTHSHNDCWS